MGEHTKSTASEYAMLFAAERAWAAARRYPAVGGRGKTFARHHRMAYLHLEAALEARAARTKAKGA